MERRVMKGTQSSLKSGRLAISKRFSNIARHNWGKEIGRQLFARAHKEVGNQIRFFVSGGSALGAELYEDFQALGLPIYEGYGLTETAPVLTVNPLGESRKGSAGKPLPGVELQIFRPDEHGIGEVIVQTSSLMQEYYGNPKATNAVIRNGWFHTGDLGRLDAEGYLYITGRIKDVIVTGAGKNVYPADLEAIYQALPGVAEVCVLGVKNGLTEDVHAIFTSSQNSPDQDLPATKKAIQRETQQLARELPSYHRLQQVHVWEGSLPREDSGQLQRVAIRERLECQLAGETPAPPATSLHKAMTPNNSKKALLEELSRLAGVPEEEVEESSHLYTDLGLDSLMAIELLLYIEHTLDVVVPDEKAAEVQTVGQLLDEVFSRGSFAKQSPAERASHKKIRSANPYTSRSLVDRVLFSLALRSFSGFLGRYFSLTVRTGSSSACFSHAGRPYIIAANHNSHLDAPALLAAVYKHKGIQEARKLHVLGARDYFFDNSLKSWFFSTFLNVVPVEREETSLAGLRLVKEILASGENVLIFPEGTRSRTGELQSFKAGLGLMALELNAPIVPAWVEGTHQALPVGSTMPCRQKLSVAFGPCLAMDDYEQQAVSLSRDEVCRQITRDVQRAVEAISSISANKEVL
jgi:long-chain acyl-CoA synthetase